MYVCLYMYRCVCVYAHSCVVCSVFHIQNKLCRFETQIRHKVPSRDLSEELRCGTSSCTIKWKIVIHVYRGCSVFPWSVSQPFGETTFGISHPAVNSSLLLFFFFLLRHSTRSQRSRNKSAASSNNTVIRLMKWRRSYDRGFYNHWVGD